MGRSAVSADRSSVGRGGDPASVSSTLRLRLAGDALAEAKADARARGEVPAPSGPGAPDRHTELGSRDRGLAVAPRSRRDDPQPLAAAVDSMLAERGWRGRVALGAVFGDWARVVGADLAGHTRPERFAAGELVVVADSTAWATQVRLLSSTLVRRVNTELGGSVVHRVKVRGPAPPRRGGRWRVPGSRGPGDTYG